MSTDTPPGTRRRAARPVFFQRGRFLPVTAFPWPVRRLRLWAGSLLLLLAPLRLQGVILFGTDDPARNTTAPTGALEGSGWQWEGRMGFFLGTAIGPRQFITASHLQVSGASIIEYRGLTYHAVGKTNLAGTDLDVLTIAGRFPDYAPLCSSRREVGRPVVLVGRGGRRGSENGTRGWFIGDYDAAQRWGTNLVDSIIPASMSSGGELLAMGFNANAGADEGIFSAGDSGGGTFVLDRDNRWKLAGVNFGVDGPFTDNTNNSPVFGALFDIRGLYVGFPGQQQFIPNSPAPIAARSIVTRISSHIDWLSARIAEPAPAEAVFLESAATPSGPFTEEPQYAVDPSAREIRAPRTNAVRFFRVRGASVLALERFEGELGVFTFR
jgi:hypothetical protein